MKRSQQEEIVLNKLHSLVIMERDQYNKMLASRKMINELAEKMNVSIDFENATIKDSLGNIIRK